MEQRVSVFDVGYTKRATPQEIMEAVESGEIFDEPMKLILIKNIFDPSEGYMAAEIDDDWLKSFSEQYGLRKMN
jgi:hypothetical protein